MSKFILSLIFIGMTSFMWSQESQQEKLEQRKAQIQQEIRDNEKRLQSVKKKEKSAVTVVVLQQNKIKLKEKLINTTTKQTKILANDMYINQVHINKLKKELDILKEDYAKMIVKSYKSRSEESRAMFILSSQNFLQAYKRAQYMKQYTSYRKAQGEEIKSKSNELIDYNGKLSVQKTAKQKLIEENEKERLSLEKEKKEQLKLVNSIKKDKNKIASEIKKRQQEARQIDRQIQKLIRDAIAESNRKLAAERAKANPNAPVSNSPVSSTKLELTPEAKIIADNFRSNKGRLPYPVEKGFISLGFGNQAHPIYKTLTVHNSGVDITTEKGSNARAVFEGEVMSINVSTVNKAVIIKHGDYITVYQNLSSVAVSKGEKVSLKQNLGRIRTNGDTGLTILKFLVMQNSVYSNPASWLSPR